MILQKEQLDLENFIDQYFLFLTAVKDFRIRFSNNPLKEYCGLSTDVEIENSEEFYRDRIHPQDYEKYKTYLRSFLGDSEKEEKILFVRIKNKEGKWNRFCLRSRLYNADFQKEAPIIITLAFIAMEPLSERNNSTQIENTSQPVIINKYQDLLFSLDDGLSIIEMIYDENGNPVDYLFLQTNPAFENQINLRNVQGKTIRELIPDYGKNRLQSYGKIATDGKPMRSEFKAEEYNNSWFDLYAFKIGNKTSRQVAVIFRNITERKLAEEELVKTKKELEKAKKTLEKQAILDHKNLLASRELLQTVFDTTNHAIAVFHALYNKNGSVKDFKFIRINKVLREMYQDVNPIGRTYLEITKYGVKMGIFDALKKVMETGEPLDDEFYFDKEGYHHWFRFTARSHNDLLIATIEDISKRKAEAQELQETIRFKQQLVRTSPETIMIINLNTFTIRYINKDILPNEGLTKEKIQGMDPSDVISFIHPWDRKKVLSFHKALLKSTDNDVHDIEIRIKLKGTYWEWFSVRGKVFHRRDTTWVNEYVLLVRNITEQKKIQKDLIKAEKLSIQGEIARTLAHELRNPLASIGLATDLITKRLDGREKEIQNYLDIQRRSTKTINELVSELLDSSNYSPSALQKEDLAEIMDEALSSASDRIYLAGVKVIKNYNGPFYIQADEQKLVIALLNIIVNACEATPPGQGLLQVSIEKKESDFVLSIRDNGHGLEPDQVSKLFDAFYTNKKTGVGIGLNSVKYILEEHDAKIDVWSKPNKGTCFSLLFPGQDDS